MTAVYSQIDETALCDVRNLQQSIKRYTFVGEL